MNDQADLLRMICRYPDDNAPRLVYADWLEEKGDDDYAMLIRLGVNLVNGSLSEHERWQAGIKYRQLEVLVVPRLMDELPRVHGATWQPILDRGFVARMTFLNPDVFLRRWADVFDIAPIRYLELHELNDHSITHYYDIPVLEQLRSLSIVEANLTPHGWTNLLRLASWVKLVHLDVSGNPIGDEGARIIAHSSALLNLTSLNLEACTLTDAGAQALSASPYLKQLRRLYVGRNTLSSGLLQQLRRRFEFVFVTR